MHTLRFTSILTKMKEITYNYSVSGKYQQSARIPHRILLYFSCIRNIITLFSFEALLIAFVTGLVIMKAINVS